MSEQRIHTAGDLTDLMLTRAEDECDYCKFLRERGITTTQEKWLDHECYNGCKSLRWKGQIERLEGLLASLQDCVNSFAREEGVQENTEIVPDLRSVVENVVYSVRKKNEQLRAVPFVRGPDGEPNEPDLGAYADLRRDYEQLEKQNAVLALKARYVDKAPFCPDHRDKVAGKPCRECEIERLTAELASAREQLQKDKVARDHIAQAIAALPGRRQSRDANTTTIKDQTNE